jgi:hypothetical protein
MENLRDAINGLESVIDNFNSGISSSLKAISENASQLSLTGEVKQRNLEKIAKTKQIILDITQTLQIVEQMGEHARKVMKGDYEQIVSGMETSNL